MFDLVLGLVPARDELEELYSSVGWSAYTEKPENLVAMCRGSHYLACARDFSGRLIGLVRTVGDGVTITYIQDLLVHPDAQGQGVGSSLLDAALEAVGGVRQVYISTDAHEGNKHVIDLYLSRGFRPVGDYNCLTLASFK
ncbi:GNAT family N-acetyltransferase [Rothia sp. CCM 9417]|uniref:GNAT family N-acetyltransferase n=1 Tax=unclassified Rothia (in: high G+C Gram-positive bacteria) TaxID=2689056 RepID=UPI003AC0D7A8